MLYAVHAGDGYGLCGLDGGSEDRGTMVKIPFDDFGRVGLPSKSFGGVRVGLAGSATRPER